MTYRRAAIPAGGGGLLLTALLWWAGTSESALLLQGSTDVLGAQAATDLERRLAPWSYDPTLLTSQFLRMLVDGTQLCWDLTVAAGFGDGIPAALTWGLVAGVTSALTLRVAVARTRTTDPS
ncbi:hypothetical protein IQ62_05670 [Streptomyces scabiei]|uniref:hypothetical protein n=1 Tax=Streptomyces scabiei TaxID=1930 RepID=UPI0004E6B3E7|nr:hypothetical protein [Streptomyces scabiei]KFG01633.1 hypothetical protein IQ62_05670 [Streptomyces scabiei]